MAGALEVPRHRHDRRFVHAALHHHVDLDRCQACRRRGVDALQHLAHREVDVVHRLEGGIVERIEADGHPRQARILQRTRLLRQQRAIGRQRDVEIAQAAQHRHQLFEMTTQQRLAAGQPDLAHAKVNEHAGDAGDLLEGQQLGVGQEWIVVAEDVLRHAVDAAKIAAVGDRDPQVVQAAAADIGDNARQRGRGGRAANEIIECASAAGGAKIGDGNDGGHGGWRREPEMVADGAFRPKLDRDAGV